MPGRLPVILVALLAGPAGADHGPLTFERDVRPILRAVCFQCHGEEANPKGKLDLRLVRLMAAGGRSGPAVVPGKLDESVLWEKVASDEMPKGTKKLTAEQKATVRRWIEQGAKTARPEPADPAAARFTAEDLSHWSFQPVKSPPAPGVPGAGSPIDAFLLAKLRSAGISGFTPEADRRTLIRRLTFDLYGLPPTPADIDAFLADRSPGAYERLVDRLLASPRYGERWGRHWLDVVRYADTHGYDKDKPRPHAWPYRDYVIRALNADKPYTRFVQEQIAGDVLFPGTADGVEALGFLAAGPWDFIGHAELPESKTDGRVARNLDRDEFVTATLGAFASLTVGCARCHDHKFDPITQDDYYALQAVFAAIDRTDKRYDPDPVSAERRTALLAARRLADARLHGLETQAHERAGAELAALNRQLADARKPSVPRPEFGYHSAVADRPDRAKWVQVDLGASISLDRVVLRPCHDDFAGIGAGFGFPVRFKVEASDDPRLETGVTVLLDRTAGDVPNPRTAPVAAPAGGRAARYVRVTATALSRRLPTDFIFALAELEAFDGAGTNRAAGAAVTALDSTEAPTRWRRANLTDGIYPGPAVSASEARALTARREAALAAALGPRAAEWRATVAEREAIDRQLQAVDAARKTAYIGAVHTGSGTFVGTGANGGRPRPVHVLARGDVTRPGRLAMPGAVAALPVRFDLPADHTEGDRRAALARWLTDPAHPLVWRSVVNRVWQYHFGRGIVDSPNDFGKMGQSPSHPELLDWLAADFRDHGGSLKRLHRQIVTSAAYRQAVVHDPARAKLDADNRLLWRQNRRKLEAEEVRDAVLAVAGKLDLTTGGPGFQDFVVEKPEHSPHYQYHLHDPDDPRSHRRSVYRFVVRSKTQPFLTALDCADPSLSVDRRTEGVTPQQALALLNNRLVRAMSRHFAARVEGLATDTPGRVTAAVRLALGRDPTPAERDELVRYANTHGLAEACRLVFNLTEFVFVD
ncbi:MAG: DUF1553 domain-containing protein [Gemmataceae bacterium]